MSPIPTDGLQHCADGKLRCWWVGEHPDYQAYHDLEWGRRIESDRALFEKLCLEAFQAGLSWLTILRKRENFRQAFDQFNFEAIAQYDAVRIEQLMQDPGIVRNRRKIEAVVNNARLVPTLLSEFGSLRTYFEQYCPEPASRPAPLDAAVLQTLSQTPESKHLSKDLKRRGWRFVGPTTLYAFMQSVGLVNDHVPGCWARSHCNVK
ncbi:MAG: DNA-3-methyladenine glycosylase I [Spirulina sp. SIO3F2]|nr:DNA-3-methyladenine glycosylase I [Spirulina sp. SIO3F2]